MSKDKIYSNIQDEEDHFDDDACDPTSTPSSRREITEGTIYGEPFVDDSLSNAPGTISPRGDSIRMSSPISPACSDMARAATMPDSLSKFRKAARTAIHARRMSSKHVYAAAAAAAAKKKRRIGCFCITDAILPIAKAQQRQGKR
jgi:hypothetical protein